MAERTNQNFAEMINAAHAGTWAQAMDLHIVRATTDEVVAELTIGPSHRQAYGIVHGGVYAGIIETIASVGAAIHAMADGKSVVGLENHTSFLRAVRDGKLLCTAKPVTTGRRSHVWEGNVHDEKGRLVATGRVRLLALDADADLAGSKVTLGGGES